MQAQAQINQTGQSKTWKETSIEFRKVSRLQSLSKHLRNLLTFSFRKINFFIGKKTIVETISVTIDDSSDVFYFDLYLINISAKSTKAETCTGVMFKLTLNCLSVTVEDLNL